jgi:VCBS repeat-containing protein
MLVAFSGSASVQGSDTWLDAAAAKSLLATLNANGSTNYDVALQQVMDHFTDSGKLTGSNVQNISYFLSDGQPTDSGHLTYGSPDTGTNPSSDSVGIIDDDLADWQQFLADNNINSLSFGMGTGADVPALSPIAYNGDTNTDADAVGVPTLSNLPDILLSTVPLVPTSFNLLPSGGFGADGGHIASVVVDTHTFGFDGSVDGSLVFSAALGSFDSSTHVWTINSNGTTAAGGTIVVDMNTGLGSYNVSPTSSLIETLHYNLIDNDGDGAAGDLVFNLNAPPTLTIDTGNRGNANDMVYESGLNAVGSDPSSNNEFAAGSFTVGDPNNLGDVTSVIINGGSPIALGSLAGSHIDSTNGTLTILTFDAATGVATYEFELKTPTTNLPGVESNAFTLEAVDVGGLHSAPQTLTFEIINDVPTAKADVDAVTAASSDTATGNVVTGVNPALEGATGAGSDGAADTLGADRLAGNDYVIGVATGSPSGPLTNNVGSTLFGMYGSLSLAANGDYTYTLYPSTDAAHTAGYNAVLALDSSDAPLVDTFSYTIEDADGDRSTTTLKVTVNGSNEGSTITVNQDGIGDQVFESALGSGSDPSSNGEFATGHFTIADPDGLDDIKGIQVISNGTSITFSDLQLESIVTANPATWLTFNTENGTVTLNNYNSSTGVVAYQFELKTPTTDVASATESNSFTIAVTDDGSTYSAPINISIVIVDDVPTAFPNTGSVTEDGVLVASGNVLGNDTSGADTLASFVSWGTPTISSGNIADYGTLTLNPTTGDYNFTLNNALPAVQALHASDHINIQVGYTMKDADGDPSPSTLTITINGNNDGVTINGLTVNGGEETVFEKNLIDGSLPNNGALTQTGDFSVVTPDGFGGLSIGATQLITAAGALTGNTVSSAIGTLSITAFNSITGVVSYSYTLTDNAAHPNANGANSISDSFTITVADSDGSTANASLDITVIDDLPLALADVDAVTASSSVTATGNVVTGVNPAVEGANGASSDGTADTLGADRVAGNNYVVGVIAGNSSSEQSANVGSTLFGAYGSLTLAANGNYTYTLYASGDAAHASGYNAVLALGATSTPLTDTFSYTIKDNDGDWSTNTLTLTVNGSNEGPNITFNPNNAAAIVSEEALSNALIDNVLLNSPINPDPADAVGNPKTAQGSFTVSDVDLGDTLSVALLNTGLPALTSNGVAVQWVLTDSHTLVGFTGTNIPANTVLTVSIAPDGSTPALNDWKYTVELFKPVDHPNNSYEDVLPAFNVAIKVTDNNSAFATASLAISIEDDMPVAAPPQTMSVNAPPPIGTNLMLTLDVSGSMGDPSGDGVHTRLELAKLALVQLIDQYDSLGDVKVMLVAFSGSATLQGSGTWLDAATAKTLLNALSDGGSTNYDAGLQQVISHFGDSGKFTSGNFQNVAYFLSDGAPTDSGFLTYPAGETGNTGTVGIAGDDIVDWQNFLVANDINSLAYGMGTGAVTSELNPIAYNGSTVAGTDTDSVPVPTLADLPNVLLSSIPLAPYAFNLMPSGGFGADGGHIASITVDSIVYRFDGTVTGGTSRGTYDVATHVWTINSNGTTAAGGTIVVDLDTGLGTYNVSPSSSLIETVGYTLVDNDGDGASSSITFNLNTAPTVTINTGNPGNANDVVNESALAIGTNPSSNTEFAFGTITLADANGIGSISSVTINGVTVATNALAGSIFNSTNGVLTITNYDSGTGVMTYQFELKTPTTDVAAATEINSFNITASDGSLSSLPQVLTIEIADDAPLLAITNGFIADQSGGHLLGTLVNFGADGAAANNPSWTSVAAKINGTTETFTSLGEAVIITQSGNVTTGKTADNDTIFTITAHADGTYTMDLLRAIDTSKLFDTAERILSYGDGPKTGYTLSAGAGDQLVAYNSGTGIDPDSSATVLANFSATTNGIASQINMSSSGIGAGGNNTMSAGDNLHIDLSNSAHFGAVLLSVANYTAGEGTYSVHYTDGTDSGVIPIVVGANGDLLIQSPIGKYIDYLDISHPSGAGSGNQFKVDGLNFFTQDANRVPTLDLGFTATDGDGDTVNGTVKITLDGSDPVVGTSGNDALGGAAASDTLQGNNGNDILSGAAGHDTLQGGSGNDILNGGDGSDIFVFSAAASNGVDTITDFNKAATASGGDILDITDLLSGASVTVAQFTGNEGAFLQLESDGNGNTKVMFDANGNTGGHTDAVQVATLNGVTGVDSATLLNQLLTNGEIQTHH